MDTATTGIPASARRSWSRAALRALIALVLVAAAAQVLFYFTRTVDDLFISLRYAERLVDGHGLTYNDGQAVEGFSNPLWVLLQALGIGLGVDGLITTKLLSLGSYALLFWALYRFGREVVGLSRALTWVALGMTAASSYVASWAMWGLETPLYLALLVLFLLALRRHLAAPSPRRALALAGAVVAFAACRPEAPLYVLAAAGAALFVRPRVGSPAPLRLSDRLRALIRPALLAGGALALLLLARYAYYDRWLPQTYYAKQGAGFDPARLAPLVAQGAPPLEIVYLVGALALAGWQAVRQRATDVMAVALANLFFVASVAVDWMPNQRHFLPLVVLAPFPWLTLLSRWLPHAGPGARAAVARAVGVALVAGLLAGEAVGAFAVDSRFSKYDFPSHGRGQTWIRQKSPDAWRDAWDGLRRVPPRHVAGMSVHQMGMIDRLFRVLEASSAPERASWFVGRDIGRVGYYSPIQVFDTAALFTPALTDSEAWLRDRTVDAALVDAAFAHHPVATDLLDGWPGAVGRDRPLVREHDVLVGSRAWPIALRPKAVERPSPQQVLDRYTRVVDKLRAPFFQSTLYGESVGAAIDKRFRWLRPQLLANAAPDTPPPPDLSPAEPVAIMRGAIRVLGCRLEAPPADATATVALACWFEATRGVARDLDVFVHLVDDAGAIRVFADHPPVAGLRPTSSWRPGAPVRDAVAIDVPPELRGLPLSARVGLWSGSYRAPAARGPGVDADGRVIGPTLPPAPP